MRIRRLILRNFRGVAFRELHFPPAGVTVVEGPNEVGKSSLAEAVDLLFEEPDGSTKQRVKAVKPVNADVGAEVEAEITVGPYHLVYRKRWHRQPETVLQVLAPRAEHFTGRRAHDRMNEILDETIDRALWKALRYQQGIGIAQAALGDSPSLSAALDLAATGKGLGDQGEAEDLWSRVGEERDRYFTPTGRPNAARTRLDEQVAKAEEEAAHLARALAEMEGAAEDHRRLRQELARLSGRLAEQEKVVAARSAQWSALQTQSREVERLAAEAERAAHLAERTASVHQQRCELVEQLRAEREALAGLVEEGESEAPSREAAAATVSRAQVAREEARQAHRSAEQAAELAAADFEYFRELFNLEMLAERQQRVLQAEREQGEALAFLDACPIDAARLEEIEQAYLAAATARAGLNAESASVLVEALAPTELEVDGRGRSLAAGEEVEEPVAGSLQVVLPGRVRITVTGGARTREAEQQVAAVQERLQVLYSGAGVSGDDALAAARDLERRRRAAEATARRAAQALQENLRDLTPQGLAGMIDRARERTEAHRERRPAELPLPAGRDEAQAASEEAAARLRLAKETLEQREREIELAERALREVQATGLERTIRAQTIEEKVTVIEKQLAVEREAVGDEELAAARAEARQSADAAAAAHRAAAEGLQAQNPAEAEALLENARGVLERMKEAGRAAELEMAGLTSRLESQGEAGLHDRLNAAQSTLAGLQREKEHTDRRAEAADLLCRTLGEHRDAAKRSYVAPFREQLERFGSLVFEGQLSIELDHEDLRVVSRTLDGVTVPWESLSMGAREQLSLLARLAGSVLVSRAEAGHGGVPVIVDDALGSSDPARLERLGAVLSLAGRQGQVIVLTCTPDRYRHVGSATVIRLGAGEGEAGEPVPTDRPALEAAASSRPEAGPEEPPAEEVSWGETVVECLQTAGSALGRAEIIARTGLLEGRWQPTINSLLASGQVVREGERRGARYRVTEG